MTPVIYHVLDLVLRLYADCPRLNIPEGGGPVLYSFCMCLLVAPHLPALCQGGGQSRGSPSVVGSTGGWTV